MQAVETLGAALNDLFTKKRTRLGRPFFEAMLRPPLAAGPLLLPRLLAHAAAARSDYTRAEALGLLAAALKVRGVGASGLGGCLIAASGLGELRGGWGPGRRQLAAQRNWAALLWPRHPPSRPPWPCRRRTAQRWMPRWRRTLAA